MKEFFKDWKIHVLCGIMVLAAELIGKHTFTFGPISFTLYPMLFAIMIGVVIGIFKVVPRDMMETSASYITIAVLLLGARSASTIGPNLGLIFSSGSALVLQKLGHIGTALLSIPVGVLIFGMGRSVVGAGFSISREGSLIIVGDQYGLASEEGLGVMGGYITGTLIGTIVCGINSSIWVNTGLFHPYALAMASGCGSASMFSANIAPIMEAYPAMAEELYALGYSANTFGGMVNIYYCLLLALPLSNWLYKVLWKVRGGKKKDLQQAAK